MTKSSFDDEVSSVNASSYRLLGGENEVPETRPNRLRWHLAALVLNCVILVVNTAILASIFRNVHMKHSNYDELRLPSHEYTKDATEWELRPFDDVFDDHENVYRGKPRPELDEAWQNLLKGFDIRVPYPGWVSPSSPDNSMVRLTDGSNDGMANPSFLHQIHCLRIIRESFFPEYYPITAARNPHKPGEINVHIDHCLDGLRQAAMCHADLTLSTNEWRDNTPYPQPVPQSLHKCANWEKLTTWVQTHSFHVQGDILRHQKTGVVPWDGKDDSWLGEATWAAHNAYWESKGEPWNMGGPDTW